MGKREMILNPGEAATVPISTVHRFFNPSDTEEMKFIGKFERGAEGFEKGLYIVYGLAADGLTGPDGVPTKLLHLAVFVTLSDTHLAGIGMWFASFLLKALYWYVQWSAEEERLLHKYWA